MTNGPEATDYKKPVQKKSPGKNGVPTSASDSGARFAKTTARMGMPGATSAMTRPDPAHITGVRMVLPVSVMRSSGSALA